MELEAELTEIFKKTPDEWTSEDIVQITNSFVINGRERTKELMESVKNSPDIDPIADSSE